MQGFGVLSQGLRALGTKKKFMVYGLRAVEL